MCLGYNWLAATGAVPGSKLHRSQQCSLGACQITLIILHSVLGPQYRQSNCSKFSREPPRLLGVGALALRGKAEGTSLVQPAQEITLQGDLTAACQYLQGGYQDDGARLSNMHVGRKRNNRDKVKQEVQIGYKEKTFLHQSVSGAGCATANLWDYYRIKARATASNHSWPCFVEEAGPQTSWGLCQPGLSCDLITPIKLQLSNMQRLNPPFHLIFLYQNGCAYTDRLSITQYLTSISGHK